MATVIPKENNFDLLRLVAVLQILLYHYNEHIGLSFAILNKTIFLSRGFSGIMVLFTISGFLIFASYDNNPDLKNYLRNRFLRVYPGLWTCLLATIILLTLLGYISNANATGMPFMLWLVSQLTFFQFYTPQMFRHFGTGCPNGALWTIPVELTFYLFVPLLFWLFRRAKINKNIWVILFIILSVMYNIWYQQYKVQTNRSDLMKVFGVILIPYLFYFLLGALAYLNWNKIHKWYVGNGIIWLLAYIIYYYVFTHLLGKFSLSYWTNFYHFINVLLLSQATIALAFTRPGLSRKILGNNDISYGVYLYHMPVINVLLEVGYGKSAVTLLITILLIIGVAFLSWKFVEKPALLLKRTQNKKWTG